MKAQLNRIKVFGFLSVFVIITITIIGAGLYLYLLNIMKTNVFAGEADVVDLITAQEDSIKLLDWGIIVFLLFSATLNFLTGFFMRDFPWFFAVEFFVYLIGIPFVVVIQNVITFLLSVDTVWTVHLANYPFSQVVLANIIPIYLGFSALYFVGRYASRNISIRQ